MATLTMSFTDEIVTKGLYDVAFEVVSEGTEILSQEIEVKINGVITPTPTGEDHLFLEAGDSIVVSGSVEYNGQDPALSLRCIHPIIDET